jgi:hypothetical protein
MDKKSAERWGTIQYHGFAQERTPRRWMGKGEGHGWDPHRRGAKVVTTSGLEGSLREGAQRRRQF